MDEAKKQEYEKKNKKRSIIILLLAILLGVGYAYLQTTLNITGTTHVDKTTWNVYWDDSHANASASSDVVINSMPAIDEHNPTLITYDLELPKPGSWAEFTVDAKNDGSVNAMIGDISIALATSDNIPDYLEVSFTYADGVPIYEKQILRAHTSEALKFRIAYKLDLDVDDLDQVSDDPFHIEVGISYIQADRTAHEVRYYAGVGNQTYTLGQPVPAGATVYETESLATQTYRTLVKYALDKDGNVAAAFVGAKGDDDHYYYFLHDSYENQKGVMRSIFTPNSCDAGPVDPAITFLLPAENHYFIHCADSEWDVTLDSMDKVEFVAKNGYGCCLYNNQFVCKDQSSINAFVGMTP